jgi:hypothetical protein
MVPGGKPGQFEHLGEGEASLGAVGASALASPDDQIAGSKIAVAVVNSLGFK